MRGGLGLLKQKRTPFRLGASSAALHLGNVVTVELAPPLKVEDPSWHLLFELLLVRGGVRALPRHQPPQGQDLRRFVCFERVSFALRPRGAGGDDLKARAWRQKHARGLSVPCLGGGEGPAHQGVQEGGAGGL